MVTLTGTNFNTTPANYIVFFGGTKAIATASTATTITLTVPTGATYAQITLLNTATSLAAYSLSNFTPKFSPAKTGITAIDFAAKVDFAIGAGPQSVAIGDLDGDGKPDLAVANYGAMYVSVFRNASNNADLSALTFSSGTLEPAFASGTIAYAARVNNATTNITVTATRAEANATIKVSVNGGGYTTVTSGNPSAAFNLNVGSNTVEVKVTAQDGTTIKTYTTTVTRATPSEIR